MTMSPETMQSKNDALGMLHSLNHARQDKGKPHSREWDVRNGEWTMNQNILKGKRREALAKQDLGLKSRAWGI